VLRLAPIAAVLALFTACGGTPQDGRQDSQPVGFVNHTIHSDAQLRTIWTAAQKHLAQQVDLNPLQRQNAPSVIAKIRPGDPRALSVMPHQLVVDNEVDVSSEVLFTATGVQRPDPTGLIACAPPCNVKYAAAYSRYKQPVTKYAESWDDQSNNFELILQYEFENQILFALNYDMKWR
jgi:hypothetical protein